MILLYDLAFIIFAVLYLPVFLLKRKMHPGFKARLGMLPPGLSFNKPVWIHAVSVGEAASMRNLVEELRYCLGGKRFVFTTVTPTGNRIAQSCASAGDTVTFLPLDISFIVRSFVRRVDPSLVIIAETELWPNLIRCLSLRNVPVVVVNARISDRSFKKYRFIRKLLAPVLGGVRMFYAQSQQDAERLRALGVRSERITVSGNMKFDIQVKSYDELRKDYTDYRFKLGIGPSERLWVAASTHPGEERVILEVFRRLTREMKNLRLLIAPRHIERTAEIEKEIAASGFSFVRISTVGQSRGSFLSSEKEVLVLDTIGQLMYFYAISDVVFVGGSLVKKGGHNIIEPASLWKPILFGPHMFNFRAIAERFVAEGAALTVSDGQELESKVRLLLTDEKFRAEQGTRAKKIIGESQGATKRNVQSICGILAVSAQP